MGVLTVQTAIIAFMGISLYSLEDTDPLTTIHRYGFAALATGFIISGLLSFYLFRKRHSMARVLRHALLKQEFFLAYQPVVELATGTWVGAEALVRWRPNKGAEVYPDRFIPAAEQTGLIRHITRQVLGFVAEDGPRLRAIATDFYISVNLSAADLKSPDILGQLSALLLRSGLAPNNLLVEATERGFIDAASAAQTMHDIRALGIQVAIDDFGTGYSSLSYLTTFELSHLKIDRSFMQLIGKSAAASQVVEHIIKMAQALNLNIIAEGVENQLQADFLMQHGVQYAQGWLFAKPMSIQELVAGLQVPARSTLQRVQPGRRLSDKCP